jgi:hypothetical protein
MALERAVSDNAKLVAGSGPKPTASSNHHPFRVYIADNFHFMDPDDPPYLHGSFPTLEAAIGFCKGRVDEDLEGLRNPSSSTSTRPHTAAELYSLYCSFGEDPWISGPGTGVLFSGWDYAKERCAELLSPPRAEAHAGPVVDAAGARRAYGWLRFLRWPR